MSNNESQVVQDFWAEFEAGRSVAIPVAPSNGRIGFTPIAGEHVAQWELDMRARYREGAARNGYAY